MKLFNYLILLLLFFSIPDKIFAQTIPDTTFRSIFPRNEENLVQYEKIIEFDSLSKKEISLRIKEWAINNFNSQKAALQSEDLDAGYILYQATNINTYPIPKGWGFPFIGSKILSVTNETRFSINFYIKDNKFKIIVNNISIKELTANGIWYDVISTSVGERKIDAPAVPIEEAGNGALSEYFNNKDEKKYTVRLNYAASIWRDVDLGIRNMLIGLENSIKTTKKSPFNF
jgi:hypothetical protein